MTATAFQKSTLREYFESIVVAVILALFVRTFVFQAFKIPTGSMKPNLLVGDHLLVNKFIFAPAASPLERALLPMRAVAARRHHRVQVSRGARARLHQADDRPARRNHRAEEPDRVDQRPGADRAVRELPVSPADETQTDGFDLRRKFGPVTIPDGHYFMMGDNRDDSQDSRFWGFLPQSYVKGRALFIYWSFDTPDNGAPGGFAPRWGRLFHQIH